MVPMITDHHHQVVKNNEVPAVGYRFDPTDRELIVDYLFNKVHGNPLPSITAIKECDVYGDSRAWKGLFEALEEDTLYFFTRLKKKAEKGKRIDRVTDSGTWKGQQSDKEIFCYDGNQMVLIGSKSNFSFIPKEGVKESRGTWVMHEYRLKGCQLDQNTNSCVLCRIKKMKKKGKKGWAASDYNDDDDDNGSRTSQFGPRDHDVGAATTEADFQTHQQAADKEIFSYNRNPMVHIGSRNNFSFIPKLEGIQETKGYGLSDVHMEAVVDTTTRDEADFETQQVEVQAADTTSTSKNNHNRTISIDEEIIYWHKLLYGDDATHALR